MTPDQLYDIARAWGELANREADDLPPPEFGQWHREWCAAFERLQQAAREVAREGADIERGGR